MRKINLWDLSNLAEIKADLLGTIFQLEVDNGCTKNEAADDLKKAVVKLMELEEAMQYSFSEEIPSKTKNRPNASTLASARKAILNS